MSQIIFSLFTWLHAIATVLFIGHSLLLSLLYLPAFGGQKAEVAGPILSEVSKRSRNWMYASLLVFMITGIYLMLIDPNYLGIGNFGNAWGVLMLVKHLVVVVMLVLGFWFNAMLRVGPQMASELKAAQGLKSFRLYANLMAICGVLILLLTAAAQLE